MLSRVLVLGSGGQLGSSIKSLSNLYNLDITFADREELDITNFVKLESYISKFKPSVIINCAAYTLVDKAEENQKLAFAINEQGAKNIAICCMRVNAFLFHFSTDYVFDGKKNEPYTEHDMPNPLSVYGKSKLAGEYEIIKNCNRYAIIRTSWLYSRFGNNFVKTIIELSKTKKNLNVINDQVGTPTNAFDLSCIILDACMRFSEIESGVYHYSNSGSTSWYEFAKEILNLLGSSCNVSSISTSEYCQVAVRPRYSVLCSEKIKKEFKIELIDWRIGLNNFFALDNI